MPLRRLTLKDDSEFVKFFSLTHRSSALVPYMVAWEYQKDLLERRFRDEVPDTFLFVEHPPTITRGRGLQRKGGAVDDLHAMPLSSIPKGTEYFEIERGGDLTWHGPGQLVIYPIVKLDGKGYGPNHDVTGFLRKLEQSIGSWLESYGLTPDYRAGSTGIWIKESDKKVASIGIAVRKWITYHGVGVNLMNSLDGFQSISPCGFTPDVMTTLTRESSEFAREAGGTGALTPGVRYRVEREIANVFTGRDSDVTTLAI